MKKATVKIARPVKIIQNSSRKGDQWGKIADAETGELLHVGRLPYIRQVARKRYNTHVNFS